MSKLFDHQTKVPILPDNVKHILSMNIAHDASVCYLVDGKVQWMIEEERLTHRKHDSYPLKRS